MLTLTERIIFLVACAASLAAVIGAARRLIRILGVGWGHPDWRLAWKRLPSTILRIATFRPVFRTRFWVSLFHALVGWGFGFYVLVNLFDVVRAFAPGFTVPGRLGDLYRLLSDLLTAAVLVGMIFLVLRRFVFRPASLSARDTTLLHPRARAGIRRDSAIVAAFIIVYVGARWVGESLRLALPSFGKYYVTLACIARLEAGPTDRAGSPLTSSEAEGGCSYQTPIRYLSKCKPPLL